MDTAREIARLLLEIKAVTLRTDPPFTWTSGLKMPMYCDNRLLVSYPDAFKKVVAGFKKTIEENQESINNFLKSAGYKYTVEIITEPDSYKMKLIHNDLKEHIESASKHLSYGEKNAFSLFLFMHQVLS
jgi:hypothetical protein